MKVFTDEGCVLQANQSARPGDVSVSDYPATGNILDENIKYLMLASLTDDKEAGKH